MAAPNNGPNLTLNPPNPNPPPQANGGAPQSPPPVPPKLMWVAPVVSFAVLAGFFIMLGFLLSAQLHGQGTGDQNKTGLQNVLFTLLGALGAAFTQVVNFWLGSSKGSSDKTHLLASQLPKTGQ